jgi:hypothetical protein
MRRSSNGPTPIHTDAPFPSIVSAVQQPVGFEFLGTLQVRDLEDARLRACDAGV